MKRRLGRLLGCSSSESSDGDGDDEAPGLRTDGGTVTAPGRYGERSRLGRLRRDERVQALLFWVPPFLLMGWFVYGAIGWNFVISLTGWRGLGDPDYGTLTLENYERFLSAVLEGGLLDGSTAYWATRNTIVLLVAFTAASLLVGLGLAILVDQDVRFENTLRTVYLLPMSLSFVVTAIFWAWLYNPEIGLVNEGLRALGLGVLAMDWMGDPRTKLAAIMFALTWQFSGYCMVVYLAGLRAIPDDHYEAAKVDGASTVRMYRRVVLPQLRGATTSAAVVLMVFALKAFDFIFVLFGTTPGPSADILSVMMFREAFSRTNWAYGSTVAMLLFLMALGVIAPYLYSQYRRGEL